MTPVEGDEQELTRKQRRDQARAQRKELEEQAAAQAVRRTRLIRLGSVIGVVVIVIAVIAVASSGGGGHIKKGSKEEQEIVSEVKELVGGIHQEGNALGRPTAPVTLRYFGDLECPICKEFTLGALPTLIQNYVRSGKLRIEYRSLETATREPEVFKDQQVAAYAAGKQNLAWYFIELFYHEQGEEDSGYVNEAYLQGLAHQVPGLNYTTWIAARSDSELATEVSNDAQAASGQGFTGTPSFLVGRTGGTFNKLEYSSLTNASSFEAAINKLLAT